MMNRETDILNEIGNHPNKITLIEHFYTKTAIKFTGETPIADAAPGRKFLNLVTDFMPMTLAKYNRISRDDFGDQICHPKRVAQIR
jgi:hypothetical protein